MNADNFTSYLQEYSLLYQMPYQELKSLVMQYPYSANLHYLLVIKSHLEKHEELEQNIRAAALVLPHRSVLYRLVQQLQAVEQTVDSFELTEDYLELKDLNTLEPELTTIDTSITPQNTTLEELLPLENKVETPTPPSGPSPTPVYEESEIVDHEILLSKMEQEGEEKEVIAVVDKQKEVISTPTSSKTEEEQSEPEKVTEVVVQEGAAPAPAKKDPIPTPKSSFSSWIQQFQPAHINLQLGELMESKKREDSEKAKKEKRKKRKRKDKITLFAEKSVKETQDLASETLAEILSSQHQFDKAIEMYRRLQLKFPEKSSYFAAKIENLKNNLL